MDSSIRIVDLAELADRAARIAVQTHERQENPFEPGTLQAKDWQRRYEVALLRHSAHEESEGSA